MHSPILTLGFRAASALAAASLAVTTAVDRELTQAGAAPASGLLFVTDREVSFEVGDMADVHVVGPADVKLGGTVAPGDPITSDVNGAAVKAAPASGVQVAVAGHIVIGGEDGEIGTFIPGPYILTGV